MNTGGSCSQHLFLSVSIETLLVIICCCCLLLFLIFFFPCQPDASVEAMNQQEQRYGGVLVICHQLKS